jgi:DNA-binding NarL/FixJ family response regulator
MSTAEAVRVLVVDDQALVRTGIVMVLSAEPDIDVVAEAETMDEALSLVHLHSTSAPPIDVAVIDVRMPGIDGVAGTRTLLAEGTGVSRPPRVLMVTTFPDDDIVLESLRAGASGFVLKHAIPAELVDAVRTVAAGGSWIDKRVVRTVIDAATHAPATVGSDHAALGPLTAREREVLILMAQGLDNRQIRDRLTLSEATVKTHVARILSKTGVHDRGQAIALAYRSGLVSVTPLSGKHLPDAPGGRRT